MTVFRCSQGRSCVYANTHLRSLFKKCFVDLNLYEAVKSPGLVSQSKIKCLLMKRTPDDIIETKQVYIQLFF